MCKNEVIKWNDYECLSSSIESRKFIFLSESEHSLPDRLMPSTGHPDAKQLPKTIWEIHFPLTLGYKSFKGYFCTLNSPVMLLLFITM